MLQSGIFQRHLQSARSPGGGYNLTFLLSKKYENKLNVESVLIRKNSQSAPLMSPVISGKITTYAVTDRTTRNVMLPV